jgi:hypothetical protein
MQFSVAPRSKAERNDVSDKGLKRAIIAGAIIGAVITLGTAFAMDHVLSDSLQGTWRDAAAKDVRRMFGPACGQNWFAVTFVLSVVMAFLAVFGAVLGIIGAVIINRFFRFLLK